jgi:hypothetical protein
LERRTTDIYNDMAVGLPENSGPNERWEFEFKKNQQMEEIDSTRKQISEVNVQRRKCSRWLYESLLKVMIPSTESEMRRLEVYGQLDTMDQQNISTLKSQMQILKTRMDDIVSAMKVNLPENLGPNERLELNFEKCRQSHEIGFLQSQIQELYMQVREIDQRMYERKRLCLGRVIN